MKEIKVFIFLPGLVFTVLCAGIKAFFMLMKNDLTSNDMDKILDKEFENVMQTAVLMTIFVSCAFWAVVLFAAISNFIT